MHLDILTSQEILETTSSGAYAMHSRDGSNTRRYHGLLVAGVGPDDSREVLVSRCDEVIHYKKQSYELGHRIFQNATHPQGQVFISHVSEFLHPRTTYEIPNTVIKIEKSILACKNKDCILVRYTSLCDDDLTLELQPFLAFRNYHSLHVKRENTFYTSFSEDTVIAKTQNSSQSVYMKVLNAEYESKNEWHRNLFYPKEKERGYDFLEDIYLPATLTVSVAAKETLYVTYSTSEINAIDPKRLWEEEIERRKSLLEKANCFSNNTNESLQSLALSADQFIVRRKSTENRLETDIIAGYPWFTCWARDSMISLTGVCLYTNRFEEAKQILLSWASKVSKGMLPNRLGVKAEEQKYNTVDGTLWFLIACYRYLAISKDTSFITATILETFKEIIEAHIKGTRHAIKLDPKDALLSAGNASTQLTWMDARHKGTPITPRHGKAIEINALWYNCLKIVSQLFLENTEAKILDPNKEFSSLCDSLSEQCRTSFNKTFWIEEGSYFGDCVNDNVLDTSLRPNQIFALSLPFPIVDTQKAVSTLDTIEARLFTPYGLRTLSVDNKDYKGTYEGDLETRDHAYHQGTVWPWLLGAYVQSLYRYRDKASATILAEKCLNTLIPKGAFPYIPEVYNGSPPHLAGGCPNQAWSVAAAVEILYLIQGS